MHPDDFLLDLHTKCPAVVLDVLIERAGDLGDPPMTLGDGLDALGRQAPRFAATMRSAPTAATGDLP